MEKLWLTIKEYFLIFAGLVIGLCILYYATWCVCSACPNILFGWVFFSLLSTIIIAGYGSFKIKIFDIELSIKKIEKIKQDIDHSFTLFIPLVVSMAYSDHPSFMGVINRLGSREYIYNLMTGVLRSSTYGKSTQLDLIKRCKWYLMKNLFETFKSTPIINQLSKQESLLENTINNLYNIIKKDAQVIDFDEWLQMTEKLTDADLINNMDESSRKNYLEIIQKHRRELVKLVKNNKLSKNYITNGVL